MAAGLPFLSRIGASLHGKKADRTHAFPGMAREPGIGQLWPVWGVLAACVWIAFSPVLGNGFVDWDDQAGFSITTRSEVSAGNRSVTPSRLSPAASTSRWAGWSRASLRALRPRPAGLSPGQPPVPRLQRGPLASPVRQARGAGNARGCGATWRRAGLALRRSGGALRHPSSPG